MNARDIGLTQPPYDARVVANFILAYHFQKNEEITQLRLYKLLYFAHAWYLAENSVPLVWNYFEAWEHGPVIKVVRDCFARFAAKPITILASMFDFRAGQKVQLPDCLNEKDEIFVSAIIEAYRRYSATELSQITHTKGSAWDRLWRSKTPVGRFGLRITNDEILTDVQELVVENESRHTANSL